MLVATTAFDALRLGASVFRGLIDLPARAAIGAVAFAEFSRATDLSAAGFAFYVAYGVGGALLTLITWFVARRTQAPPFVRRLTGVAAVCSALVLLLTTQAAPLMLQLGSAANDPELTRDLLDRFARWTYPRFACVVVSFAANFTALARLAWSTTEAERG